MAEYPGRRSLLRAGGFALASGLAGCLGGSGSADPAERVRSALEPYTEVGSALEAGYEMSTPYVRTDAGVLGLPFINAGVTELDEERPRVLYYNVGASGGFELLGAEWLVATDAVDEAPTLFGRSFHEALPGHTAFLPEHYGLHAWPFGDNPEGVFNRYHAGASPPSFIGALETAWEALSPFFTNEERAKEAGYSLTEQCVTTPDGGLGVPVYNADATGTDPTEPAVLLYRLSSTWSFRLLGAEWHVPADEVSSPPTLFGQSFHDASPGHYPHIDQPEHYGLHAWLFLGNPRGMFAASNPTVRC